MLVHIHTIYLLVAICFYVSWVKCYIQREGEYDVIILGAGMAGVSAARTLVKEGVTNFVIVEGRAEVGGRMHSIMFGDVKVEGGAQWIHLTQGSTENPVFEEAMKYNVSGFETNSHDLLFYDEDGNDITVEGMRELVKLDRAYKEMRMYGERLWANQDHSDISVKGSLRRFGFNPKTPVQMACEYYYIDMDTADHASVSSNRYIVAASQHPDFGEQDFLVTDPRGYAVIPKLVLTNEVPDWKEKLHLETIVTAINYTDNRVVVTTNKGMFTGKKVIVTFSIGVLQNSLVQFYPGLPDWKLESLHAFPMNDYIHVYVRFNPNIVWFVPYNKEWILYASKWRGYFTIWHNINKAKPGSHILQTALTGTEARRLQASTDEEVKSEVMAVLKNMFGQDVPEAEEILIPRLHTDPFFQGSFSDWPVGYTRSQHKALQSSIGSVYFAGESYSLHQFGYVHGALISGEDVAKDVAACIKDLAACAKPYTPPYAAKGCTYRVSLNFDPNAQIDDGSCMMVIPEPTSGSGVIHQKSFVTVVLILFFVLTC